MELKLEMFSKMRENYLNNEVLRVSERAVTSNGVKASAQNVHDVDINDFVFSVDVDSEAVANQLQSGRCWMFAALNTLRIHIEKDLKLPKGQFELSQNYNFFYDKLEKANFFYQQIINTADAPLDDRAVYWLLSMPQQDGGDWDLISALITKYGVCPRTAMVEVANSKNSADLDEILNKKLRQDALELRAMVRKGESTEAVDARRLELLEDIYHILGVCLGLPPEKFDFEYRDKDGNYHGDFGLTPQEFAKKYVPIDVNDYVGIINVPIDSMPYGKVYGIEMSDEIIGGRPNRYLNVPMEDLKALTIKQLKGGEPVWFGCDVMQFADTKKGILSPDLYNFNELFDIDYKMGKGDRYLTHESLPTHAMVLGGVNIVDNKPEKWKIENSWGTEAHGSTVGFNGYYICDDKWFDEYVFEVVIRKDLLTDEQRKAFDGEPEVLPFYSTFNPV